MKRMITRIIRQILVLSIVSVMLLSVSVQALNDTNEIPYNSYTYWQEFNSEEKVAVYTKPMYEVETVVYSSDIGIEPFETLTDIYSTSSGDIYVIDSKASKVVRLDKNFKFVSSFNTIKTADDEFDFKGSLGIYVDDNGLIYICGTEAEKLWITDNEGNLVNELMLPDSEIIPDNFKYRPIKVVKDDKGYIYILSDGSYHGTILYSPEYEFLGFYGANPVKKDVLGVLKSLWDRLTMNDTKRGSTVKQLPYQFTDMVVDEKGFVYTATGNTGQKSQSGQIKRLNPAGDNILDSDAINFADVGYDIKNQDLCGIDIDSDGYIYVLDSTYGRIFVYDSESKLLCAFGSGDKEGEQKGSFKELTAITLHDEKILACDKAKGTITVFGMTDYGKLVKETRLLTINSKYSESKEGWKKVLEQDRNSQLAYVGLAKAALFEKDYDAVLDYARLGADRETYSSAFQYVRRDFFAKHFTVVFIGIVIFVIVAVVLIFYLKKNNIKLMKNKQIRNVFSIWSSPFKTFQDIKEKKEGSLIIAVVIAVLFYVSEVVKNVYTGFAFSYYDASSYSVLYTLASTIGLIILWVVVNWAVCTLLGGIGKIKEIAIVTCYGIVPIVIANFIYTVSSNILTISEGEFLTAFMTILYAFAFFLIAVGIIIIHDFAFGRFLGTTILTILGMMLVVFLIFLVVLLVQQLGAFIVSVMYEILY